MNEATAVSEEDEDKIVNIKQPKFAVLPGGKPPESTYWLRDLPELYVFITRRKPHGGAIEYGAVMLQVMKHADKCSALYDVNNNNRFWVHTNDFSRAHECLEVIPVQANKEDEDGVNSGAE